MVSSGLREVVGLFRDLESLRDAADDLMIHGFDRARLDLLDRRRSVRLGEVQRAARELEDDPRVRRRGYVGTDSLVEARAALVGVPAFVGAALATAPAAAAAAELPAMIGWALAGAAVGGGLGALVSRVVGVRHARRLRDEVALGGLLLWVAVAGAAEEATALAILERSGATDVHVQERPEEAAGGPVMLAGYLDWLAGMPRRGSALPVPPGGPPGVVPG